MNEQDLFEEIVAIRRDIHQHPELQFDVERTSSIASNAMRKNGISVRENVGHTGVVGDIHVEGATKRIALRADMDALPMDEERESPYKSKIAGRAHMCGHDSHTAMLIGTAKILSRRKSELNCNVRFIFQPCEERLPGGAPAMIKDGAIDDVDEIYAVHVWPTLPVGKIGINRGPAMAQPDTFEITINGAGGHAGAPHTTIDPIIIGAQIVNTLQSIVSRTIDPCEPAVISVTQFHAGSADNVIPASATLIGTVRSYSKKAQTIIKEKIHKTLTYTTEMHGATCTLNYREGFPVLINDLNAEKHVLKTAKLFMDEKDINYPGEKVMFGEDFAYYTEEIPGCYVQLGCRNEEKECIYPLHHPRFNLDEECMKTGMKLLSSIALEQ